MVVERRPDGTFVLPLGLPAVAPQVERRNCWTCRHAYADTKGCRLGPSSSAVYEWISSTHQGADRCPPDADGCPGWQPTDPPPSAEVSRG